MDNDNLFNVAFRKFGGLNYSANNNVAHSTYSNATNMLVSNQVGAKNTEILIQSNTDMSNSSFFNIDTAYFDATTVTSQNGALTFNNTSGSTGLNFNVASGTTYRFNTTGGSSIAIHEQTISTASGDLSFTAPSTNTVFIDPDITVPKITTRPGTDLFITTGSPDGHIRADRIIDISGNVIETGDSLFIGDVGITGSLGVTGPSAFNGTVGITGTLGVTGPSTFIGDVGITGLFGVTGTSSFNNFVGITGFLGVTGTTNINDHVGITGIVGVTGRANINGHVVVTSTFGVTGQSIFDGNVDITGIVGVTGVAIFNGPVGIIGPIGVTGHSTFDQSVYILGDMNADGTSVFNGTVGIIGPVVVTGAATFDGIANVNGPFGITGIAEFDGQVGIRGPFGATGSSVFNGSVGVTGPFGVTGSSIFDGSVGIRGPFGTTGASTFVGSVGITGRFGVTGVSTFNGSVGVDGLFGVTGPSAFNGSVGITGSLGVTGSSVFNGSVGISGAFGVTGSSIFNGSVGITGLFGVTGPTILNGNANFIGDIQIIGDTPILFNNGIGIEGTLGITGPTTLNGSVGVVGAFGVTGPSTLNGNVTMNGPVTIDGSSSIFHEDLTIAANGSFTSNDSHTFVDDMSFNVLPISKNFNEPPDNVLAIRNYVDTRNIPGSTFLYKDNIWTGTNKFNTMFINPLLGFTGTSAFNGSAGITCVFGVTGTSTFNGSVGVNGAFGVTGTSVFNGPLGASGAFGVAGASIFNGPVGITGLFGVTGASTFNGSVGVLSAFGVTGTSTFNGSVGVTGAFDVTGTSIFNVSVGVLGSLGVTGVSIFNRSVGVLGAVGVAGTSIFNGTVGVTGLFGVTGASTFDGSVGVTGRFGVTGSSIFNGSVCVTGLFGVTGASIFNGSVGVTGRFGVTGTSAFNGSVGVTGRFGVTGASVFNGSVGITGLFGVTGSSVFNGSLGVIGEFGVTGVSIFNGSVGVTGTFGVTGGSIFNGSVGVTGLFGVTGASIFNGSVGVTGLFGVTGSSVFNGSVVVAEAFNMPAASNSNFLGSVGISDAFDVAGTSTFNRSVIINNTFGVTGETTFNGSVGVTGTSIFNGSVGISGAFGVTGVSTFNGAVGVTGLFGVTGSSIFDGSVGIRGAFGVTGPSVFNGSVNVTGDFEIFGGATFNGPIGINDAFGVTGPSTFNGSVGVTGLFGVTGASVFNGSVGVIGASGANGTFGVTGASIFDGSVGIVGLFGVTGTSIFNGSVGVIGLFGVTGASVFNGSVGASGSFGVTGASVFNGSVGVIGASGVTGSFGVTGVSTFNGSVGIVGAFGVTGASIFDGSVGISGAFGVTGSSIFNGSVGVTGAFGVTGPSLFNGSVGVTGAFGVTGASTFNGSVGITGVFGLTGTSTFNGSVGVTGAFGVTGSSIFNGSVGVLSAFGITGSSVFNGSVGVTGLFGVTGVSTFNGSVGVTGAFGVTGASIFDGSVGVLGTFGVTGSTVFNGSVGVTGTFGVTGASIFDGSVGVLGTFGVTGSSVFNGSVGVTGAFGVTGTSVFNGSLGITGLFGVTGTSVFNGSVGVTGLFGVTGPSTFNGAVSVSGAFGITEETTFNGSISINGANNYLEFPDGTQQKSASTVVELHINQDVYGITRKKSSIAYNKPTSISNRNVVASIDNFVPRQQAYSFGKNIPNMWVAGGYNGPNTLAYSYDGINWVGLGKSIFTTGCTGIEWNGTMWVATGVSNLCKLAYSYDGINWTPITAVFDKSGSGFGYSIKWNGTMWVAGGKDNVTAKTYALAYSYDGINWTTIETTIIFGASINTVCTSLMWNGRSWFAVNNENNFIAQSFDGINWAKQATNLTSNYFIIYNGNISLFSGLLSGVCKINYVLNSGFQMTGDLQFSQITSIEWNGELFVAGGDAGVSSNLNTLAWSYDGINWEYLGITIFNKSCYGVSWNGTMWISCGNNTDTPRYNLAYSYDGKNWTVIPSSGNLFQNTTSFAGGDGGRCLAFNGARPNTITFPSNNILIGSAGSQALMRVPNPNVSPPSTIVDALPDLSTYLYTCNCIKWNGSMWVAVGSNTITPKYSIAASADGIVWTGIDASNTLFSTGKALAWNGTMWVAGGTTLNSYPIAYSYDSYTWIGLDTAIFTSVNAIAYNDNDKMWVAVGAGANSIAYSYDGINWTELGANIAAAGNAVAWNGYMWVAGFTAGTNTLAYSYNGIAWTGVGNGTFSTKCLTLDWNGQLWVAGGQGTNTIAYSSDGINWNKDCSMEKALTTAGYGIAGNANQFVAVGAGTNTCASTNTVSATSGTTYSNLYGIGNNIISSSGRGVAYNSNLNLIKWVAGGTGAYPIAYSSDGYTWSGATFIAGTTFSMCYGVASNNAAQGNQKFIAVGVTGSCVIASSTDGTQWNSNNAGSGFKYGYGVACNNASDVTTGTTGVKWVAVGEGPKPIAYAVLNTGSLSFNKTTNISLTNARGIDYSSTLNRWVAVGAGSSTIAYSNNTQGGTFWTSSTGQAFPTQGNAVAANTTSSGTYKFFAVGANTNNNSSNTILASTNGATGWVGATFFSAGVTGTTTYGSSFIAGNCVACDNYSSGDVYDSVKWVAGGTGTSPIILGKYSLDWNAQSVDSSITAINGVGCDKNATGSAAKWVAVGPTFATSTNGTSWTPRSATGLASGNCVASDLNGSAFRWIAGGLKSTSVGAFVSSSDGKGWTIMECISTDYPTITPLTKVKSIACYYDGSVTNGPLQAKWVAVCEGSANIASAVNTYAWVSSKQTAFATINGFAAITPNNVNTKYVIVGNNNGSAVIQSSGGVGSVYGDVTIPSNGTSITGMTVCNAVAANAFADLSALTTGTTKFVVVGTGRGTYDTTYSGVAPIYEFDATCNYINGANGNGYSTYLANGTYGSPNGYITGNAVACNAQAGTYGDVKWVIAGEAPAFAGIYNGRFASKWTAGTAGSGFIPTDVTYGNSMYVFAVNGGILSGPSLTNLVVVGGSGTISGTCVDTFNYQQVETGFINFFMGSSTGLYSAWFSIDGTNWVTNTVYYYKKPSVVCVACKASPSYNSIAFMFGDASNNLYYGNTNLLSDLIKTGLSNNYCRIPCTFPAINNLSGIAVNALGYWVAVGDIIIYTATKTSTFSSSSGAISMTQCNAVASNVFTTTLSTDARWVVVGNNNGGVTIGYTTQVIGGTGWTNVANSNVFFTNGQAVTCNTNMWIASGTTNTGGYLHFAFSYDGISWFSLGNFSNTLSSCNSIRYIPNTSQIIAVGPPKIGTTTNYTVGDMSTNAIAWSRANSTLFTNNSVACNPNATGTNAKWVVAGVHLSTGAIIYSTDGITWSGSSTIGATGIVTFSGTTTFNSVIYGPNKWVAVGSCASASSTNYSIVYSSNGVLWTGVTNSSYISTNFKSVVWTGFMYVAVTSDNPSKYAYSYSDGIKWFAANVNNNITAKFIGVGTGTEPVVVGTTTNNTSNYTFVQYTLFQSSWAFFNSTSTDTNIYNCVACNNGITNSNTTTNPRWVIVGDTLSKYSGNGILFTSTIPMSAKAVACNNSISTTSVNWVAVGTNGIYSSIDGKDFTLVDKSSALSNNFSTIVWNNKTWVAGGSGSGCSFAYSYDGRQWFHSGISNFFSTATISFATDGANNVVAGSSISPVISYGSPGTNNITWYSPSTDLSNCEIRGVACNNNVLYNTNTTVKWVAVGNVRNATTNRIIYSYNGLTWTTSTSPANFTTAYAVAFNPNATGTNKIWVVVGSGTNPIAYSTDGISWSSVANTIGPYFGVCYNQTFAKFIAISNSGYSISSDGVNWSNLTPAIFNTSNNSIAYGNNICVAVGQNTDNQNTAVSVNDTTISWNNCSNDDLANNIFYGVACNNGPAGNAIWVAVGDKNIVTSTDGIGWLLSTSDSDILKPSYGIACNPGATGTNAKWVAVGYHPLYSYSIVYSTDPNGNSWTIVANSATIFFTTGRAVAWTGTWWVATGDGGKIAYSTNGIDWANFNYNLISGLADNLSNYISSVKWNGFYWTAVGLKNTTSNGCLLYSVDGKYWSETLDSKFLTYINSLNTIGWTSNISNVNIKHPIVAVGTGTNSAIAYSIDGYKWINVGAGIFTTGNAVAWNGTMWVAVGEGANAIAYSYDGLSWVGLGINYTICKCIAWNGSMWLAGFSDGMLVYSSNGINWTVILSSGLTSCNAIAWNGTMWLAGGTATNPSNCIITSDDGFTWTPQTNNFTICKDIKSNGQMWVAVGTATSPNAIQYSYNGTVWYPATGLSSTTTNINVVAWNGKRWVAGSPSTPNVLAYSDNGISWTSNGTISTNAIAWTGDKWIAGGLNVRSSYVFKTSFNGITWNDVSQTVLAAINGIASNPRIGATVLDSQLLLNSGGPGLDNTLDIVSGSYYQSGYTNMETTVYSNL